MKDLRYEMCGVEQKVQKIAGAIIQETGGRIKMQLQQSGGNLHMIIYFVV